MAQFNESLGGAIQAEIEDRIGKCDCDDPYIRRGLIDPQCMWHELGGETAGLEIATEIITNKKIIANPRKVPEGKVSTQEVKDEVTGEMVARTWVELTFHGMPMVRGYLEQS